MQNLQSLSQLLADWQAFADKIMPLIERLGLEGLGECDHAALRVNSVAAAEKLKAEFAQCGEIISENIINGRPILIIRLQQPLQLGQWQIPCIELPFPGDKHYPEEGWEHLELVLPGGAQSCDELAEQLRTLCPRTQATFDGDTDIKLKASSPKGEAERLANPTLAFKAGGVCVKVHPHSIQAIIASEH
ncbi:TPA: VOC family protein [Shewanella algae]|uniref:VOC family protein n=1 Tax=Shewanella algae TaxID=38313 RepID=UPI001C57815B|nr:VOC family protein [Shewanella algae]HDS1204704.1 VOC family protein [Shewanella algae]